MAVFPAELMDFPLLVQVRSWKKKTVERSGGSRKYFVLIVWQEFFAGVCFWALVILCFAETNFFRLGQIGSS